VIDVSTRSGAVVGQQRLVVEDIVAGGGSQLVEIVLSPHLDHLHDNVTKDGRWSASFRYFELRCVLRERSSGAIQCKADWLVDRGGVKSTGTKSKAEAIQWAADRMREVHLERLETGVRTEADEPVARSRGLRFSEAAALLRRRDLLPGKPGSKERAPYDLVLDIARAVWTDDPYLSDISKKHVRRMYEARLRPGYSLPDDDEDESGLAAEENQDLASTTEVKPFRWPDFLSYRRPIGRVKPQTIQGDLVDLKTALGKLVGETAANDRKYLEANPLEGMALGDHMSEKKDQAGPDRYGWVLRFADQAVERLRTIGYRYQENRTYKYKQTSEVRRYNRTEVFGEIVPGMLRYMLVLQFGHPTRPRAIRHLRVQDIARTRRELVRAINSLRFKKTDDRIGLEVLDIWTYGGNVYRRRYSKNKTERLVPHSVDTAAEHDRYMAKREAWLETNKFKSPWLFPSPRNPKRPISEKDAGFLLACEEELAREKLAEAGRDPEEFVPHFHGTAWYAYRRYWKTNRNSMGWEANRNAAYVGDWTTNAGQTADVVYATFSPHLILAVVEGKTLLEALAHDVATKEAKRAARIRPDVEDGVEEAVEVLPMVRE
jgi:hypothetical protein